MGHLTLHDTLMTLFSALTGTFGQPELWDIYNPMTYQHPMVPYDVLVDPMSMPSHPIIAEKQSTHEVLHQDARKDGDEKVRCHGRWGTRFM